MEKTARAAWLLGLLLLARPLPAQDPAAYRIHGGHRSDNFGWAVAVLNDVDGDGVNDFVASAPQDFLADDVRPVGYVHLISGKTGTVLRTWRGTRTRGQFGYVLVAMGDYDHDGNIDFVTAQYAHDIFIISPVRDDPLLRFEVKYLRQPGLVSVQFAAGDLNADGVLDLVVADGGYTLLQSMFKFALNVGRVQAYSGVDRSVLWEVVGAIEQGWLGNSVAMISDLDGDGIGEVAVGEPMDGHIGTEHDHNGRVRILRGKDGVLLRTIYDDPGYHLGYSLANLGDLDQDGFPELAVASPGYRKDRGRDQGWVGIFSTRTFEVIQEFTGLEGELVLGFHGDALGDKLGLAGDVDLDGVPDYCIAAYRVGYGIGPDYGRLDLRSGKTGRLLASYEEVQGEHGWIGAVSPLGDIDGDGRPEFIVGSPHVPRYSGLNPDSAGQGEVLVLRYEADLPRYIRGDANGDGRVNLTDGIAILRRLFYGIEDGGCLQAYDADGDDLLTPLDAYRVIGYAFLGGFAPSPPFPECGRFGGLRRSPFDCQSSPCR